MTSSVTPDTFRLSQEVLDSLSQHIPADSQRIVVALSGGLDSMVLLEAYHQLSQQLARPIPVVAIHVNHQLQSQASVWQDHCRIQCQQRQIPLFIHSVDIDPHKGSIEEAARQKRYQIFRHEAQAGDYLVTGHHQDDQVETILMRWLRSAGHWGIAAERQLFGIQSGSELGNTSIKIGRPLLGYTRQHLQQLGRFWQLEFVEDPSNQDTRYERNWWRHQGIPALRQRYKDLTQKLLQTWRRQQSQLQLLDELLVPQYQQAIQSVSWPNTLTTVVRVEALLAGSDNRSIALMQYWLTDIEQQRIEISDRNDFETDCWSHGELSSFIQQVRHVTCSDGFNWRRHWGRISVWRGAIYAVLADEEVSQPIINFDNVAPSNNNPEGLWQWSFHTCDQWPIVTNTANNQPVLDLQIWPAGRSLTKKIRSEKRPSKTFKALFQEAGIPPWLRQHWPVLINADSQVISLLGIADQAGYRLQSSPVQWTKD